MASSDKDGVLRQDRLAVLIDADQGQAGVVQALLAEVARYGMATIKRAYES